MTFYKRTGFGSAAIKVLRVYGCRYVWDGIERKRKNVSEKLVAQITKK